jgi:riboflavin kinase / FMN adenylyltransferase
MTPRDIQIIRSIDELKNLKGKFKSHVTAGAFDGVHVGHQALIRRTVESAGENNAVPVLFTFNNHPLSFLAPAYSPARLTLNGDRVKLISELGIRVIVVLEFDNFLADLSPEEFISELLVSSLGMTHIVEGYNFCFGKRGGGNLDLLTKLGHDLGFSVEVVPPVKIRDVIVSSTKIRGLLSQGLVTSAREFLGRPYSICGKVISGEGRGRHLKYPTANIVLPSGLLRPSNGVYAVRIGVEGGIYDGMMNIGYNPTFKAEHLSMEAHIFDFSGNLPGKEIEVFFINRLRDEISFDNPQALVKQLQCDEKAARKFLIRK